MATKNHKSIVEHARKLGLPIQGNCADHIKNFALRKVDEMVDSYNITEQDYLKMLICTELSLKIETIYNTSDIERISTEYSDFHPYLKQTLIREFRDGDTEGITLERDGYSPGSFDFLAIVDARDKRKSREYFTTWHEITHLLIHPETDSFPNVRRTPNNNRIKHEPLEELVDNIAGEIAFYPKFFKPALFSKMHKSKIINFINLETVRDSIAPSASLISIATQSINYIDIPTLLICLNSPEIRSQTPYLTRVIPNKLANKNYFGITKYMNVPRQSALYKVYFSNKNRSDIKSVENLNLWINKQNICLPKKPITVIATRRSKFVYGLIYEGLH